MEEAEHGEDDHRHPTQRPNNQSTNEPRIRKQNQHTNQGTKSMPEGNLSQRQVDHQTTHTRTHLTHPWMHGPTSANQIKFATTFPRVRDLRAERGLSSTGEADSGTAARNGIHSLVHPAQTPIAQDPPAPVPVTCDPKVRDQPAQALPTPEQAVLDQGEEIGHQDKETLVQPNHYARGETQATKGKERTNHPHGRNYRGRQARGPVPEANRPQG